MTAGAELFAAKGYTATTLDDITRRAGVSKGLFYQYFPSKEELVFALQEKASREFAARVGAAAAARADWPGKLDAVVLVCFEHFTGCDAMGGSLFQQLPGELADPRGPGSSGHKAAHQHLVEVIGGLLHAGVAAGAYRIDDVEATALLFFTALHAFVRSLRHENDSVSDVRLVRAAQNLVRGAAGIPTSTPTGLPSLSVAVAPTGPAVAPADPAVTSAGIDLGGSAVISRG
ncbi:TetR/AcrR family transcriptional regulator [Frankia sp. R82]|uniref:TetR/AcrR family transcriptional regulator n=1 Tax=Frankia sp. R82 TaxID=2950553 RepID=UPI0020444F3D|nr:TetR/AcrR family transcriptional regulator [Frankia sp. R82]MCM3882264.1 TetR/AcrR family transcriptional regulator [Frankia sp. R82]